MRPSRILAALVVVAVAAAAVAFTLARQPTYRASVRVVAVPRETLRPRIDPAYLRARLAAGRDELAIRLERTGVDAALLDGVRIVPGTEPGAVRVSAAAATPARAVALLRRVVLQIDALSLQELTATARRRLRRVRGAVAAALPDSLEQAALRERARGIERYLDQPRSRFGATTPRVERPQRWADRVAKALPGDFPARPAPLWAGLVGAIVGAALAAAPALARRGRPPL